MDHLFQSHTNVDNINMQTLSYPLNYGNRRYSWNERAGFDAGETSQLQFKRKFRTTKFTV